MEPHGGNMGAPMGPHIPGTCTRYMYFPWCTSTICHVRMHVLVVSMSSAAMRLELRALEVGYGFRNLLHGVLSAQVLALSRLVHSKPGNMRTSTRLD